MKKIIVILGIVLFFFDSSKGAERDWLTKLAQQSDFSEWIAKDNRWIDYPAYKNRTEWDKLPAELKETFISEAEEYLSYTWPAITATSYLAYARKGNRGAMESIYTKRKKVLETLVIAELLEGKGRFLDQIINGVWAFCEQTWWGFSAHLDFQEAGPGLPDHNDMTIDLGVGFIAADIAWTYHFFKDEFDKVNPLLNQRIKKEITEKVLKPYYSREDFFWQGYVKKDVNNWNPWCNYNVLTCIMLVEEDRSLKIAGVQKVMQSLDAFINHYNEDGGCDEGPHYWSHAGGKLFEALHVLYAISDGHINLYDKALIKNMGEYVVKAYISDDYFINFADAAPIVHARPGIMYRFGKATRSEAMIQFASYMAHKMKWGPEVPPVTHNGKVEFILSNLFDLDEILKSPASPSYYKEFWLDQTQVCCGRDSDDTDKGFFFAAKGGHNNESHNHNDVGNFILYYDGKPIIADAGVGTYTSKTFSSRRYEIWTMQSQYHNLPTINGVGQKDGIEFKANDCSFKARNKTVTFCLDIASAYPEEAKVEKWIRKYTLQRGKCFEVENSYQLKDFKEAATQSFLTPCAIETTQKGILIKSEDQKLMMKFDKSKYEVSVEEIRLTDHKIKNNWPQGLKRIVLRYKSKELSGVDSIMFEEM